MNSSPCLNHASIVLYARSCAVLAGVIDGSGKVVRSILNRTRCQQNRPNLAAKPTLRTAALRVHSRPIADIARRCAFPCSTWAPTLRAKGAAPDATLQSIQGVIACAAMTYMPVND